MFDLLLLLLILYPLFTILMTWTFDKKIKHDGLKVFWVFLTGVGMIVFAVVIGLLVVSSPSEGL